MEAMQLMLTSDSTESLRRRQVVQYVSRMSYLIAARMECEDLSHLLRRPGGTTKGP
jgi:hypothetical protein